MQKYTYKAYDLSGKFVKGTLVAADDKAFRDALHDQGMRCYEYRIVNQAKQVRYKPLKIAELIAFSRQLSSMLSAGLDLSLSLKMLYERTEKKKKYLKFIEARLFEEIQKGESLAGAMQNLDNTFPSLYISMVKSGELNGKIDEALTVPTSAVVSFIDSSVVYVVNNNIASRVEVTTGSNNDTDTVITSGLNVGDQVVVEGTVADGSAVNIVY